MTVEQIINQALVGLGAKKITSIDSSETNAETAKLFYDEARKTIIGSANWGFARRSEDLVKCRVLALQDAPAGGIIIHETMPDIGDGWWIVNSNFNVATISLPANWVALRATINAYTIPGDPDTRAYSCVVGGTGADPAGSGGVWIEGDEVSGILRAHIISDTTPFSTVKSVVYPVGSYITAETGGWNSISLEVIIDESGDADISLNGISFISFTADEIDYVYPPVNGGEVAIAKAAIDDGASVQQKIILLECDAVPTGLPGHFDYNYKVPDDFVKFLYVSEDNTPVERHGPCFMSNDDAVNITYLADVTGTDKFPPHFTSALVAKLRMDLSVPIGGRNAKAGEWVTMYINELARAVSIEGTCESANPTKYGVNATRDSWLTVWRN